jgi:hypothetical protein
MLKKKNSKDFLGEYFPKKKINFYFRNVYFPG